MVKNYDENPPREAKKMSKLNAHMVQAAADLVADAVESMERMFAGASRFSWDTIDGICNFFLSQSPL